MSREAKANYTMGKTDSKNPRARSTIKQKTTVIRFMSEHRDFAASRFQGGSGKETARRMWSALAEEANKSGPARTVTQWKKTWVDLKSQARRKAGAIRVARNRTGNLPDDTEPLIDDDKLVIDIIGSAVVEGLPGVYQMLPRSKRTELKISPTIDADRRIPTLLTPTATRPITYTLTPKPSTLTPIHPPRQSSITPSASTSSTRSLAQKAVSTKRKRPRTRPASQRDTLAARFLNVSEKQHKSLETMAQAMPLTAQIEAARNEIRREDLRQQLQATLLLSNQEEANAIQRQMVESVVRLADKLGEVMSNLKFAVEDKK